MPPFDTRHATLSTEGSVHARAIEFLADDTHTPVAQITEIYESEFAKLTLNASIQVAILIYGNATTCTVIFNARS
jgi:hypothetical protein